MKSIRIRDTLIDLKKLVKSIIQKFEYGFNTRVSLTDGNILGYKNNRGHKSETLAQVEFAFILPYCAEKNRGKEAKIIENETDHLSPLKFHPHTQIRRDLPRHTNPLPKIPKYIKNIIKLNNKHFKENGRFINMTFF